MVAKLIYTKVHTPAQVLKFFSDSQVISWLSQTDISRVQLPLSTFLKIASGTHMGAIIGHWHAMHTHGRQKIEFPKISVAFWGSKKYVCQISDRYNSLQSVIYLGTAQYLPKLSQHRSRSIKTCNWVLIHKICILSGVRCKLNLTIANHSVTLKY